jgi:hypothetical protein
MENSLPRALAARYRCVHEPSRSAAWLRAHAAADGRPVRIHLRAIDAAAGPARAFLARVAAASRSPHDAVESPIEHGVSDGGSEGAAFTVCAARDGEPLSCLLARERRLPTRSALELLVDVASGLAELQGRLRCPRRFDASAIWIGREAGRLRAWVLDVGLATPPPIEPEDLRPTAPPDTRDSCTFMSPEEARGEPVAGSALSWAIGVLAHRLCTGEAPFAAKSRAQLLARIDAAARAARPRAPGDDEIPLDLPGLARACLQRSAALRPSCATLAARAAAILARTPPTAEDAALAARLRAAWAEALDDADAPTLMYPAEHPVALPLELPIELRDEDVCRPDEAASAARISVAEPPLRTPRPHVVSIPSEADFTGRRRARRGAMAAVLATLGAGAIAAVVLGARRAEPSGGAAAAGETAPIATTVKSATNVTTATTSATGAPSSSVLVASPVAPSERAAGASASVRSAPIVERPAERASPEPIASASTAPPAASAASSSDRAIAPSSAAPSPAEPASPGSEPSAGPAPASSEGVAGP